MPRASERTRQLSILAEHLPHSIEVSLGGMMIGRNLNGAAAATGREPAWFEVWKKAREGVLGIANLYEGGVQIEFLRTKKAKPE